MRMVLAFWYPRLMREPKTEIPDLKGETVMTVTAKRVGDEIHLHVEGGNGNYTVKSLSGCKVVVEA